MLRAYLEKTCYFNLLRAFTSLCYSADGESMLAGGHSKFVCIYNIKEQILMKKFEISCNMSLDAMEVQSYLLIMNPLLIVTWSLACETSCNSPVALLNAGNLCNFHSLVAVHC